MLKFVRSPLVRISFGLVMLTLAILLISDMLGLIPNAKNAELSSRKVIAESLAVQISAGLENENISSLQETIRSVVERNDIVLSAALREKSGTLLAEYGNHALHWKLKPGEKSVATQVRVPIYEGDSHWGAVELSFSELDSNQGFFSTTNSLFTVLAFVAISGFSTYLFFLKRIMRELNPDAVIPERVRTALDTLSEGLIIIDRSAVVLFANVAFARKTGWETSELVGKRTSDLDWTLHSEQQGCNELPWHCVLKGMEMKAGVPVTLVTRTRDSFRFIVNASPILASAGVVRGVLVTFDDITEVEAKNEELQRTLGKLEQTQREITRQNQELHVLATRDPLTGSLNRRSLFQGFDTLYEEAINEAESLSCIMVDIDHFKSVNDRFGHAVGDKVIKLLARILTQHSRPNDLVGRFGGEEFCVVLPGVGLEGAAEVAERMRAAVQKGEGARFTSALRVTSSFGVSTLTDRINHPNDMVENADKALYEAKETGRNRVIRFHAGLEGGESNTEMPVQDESAMPAQDAEPVVVLDEEADADENFPDGQPQMLVKFERGELPDAQGDESQGLGSCAPGRTLLFDRVEQSIKRARRYSTEIAVVVLKVDTVDVVKDALGDDVSEKLFQSIVSKIKLLLRSTDTVILTEQDELLFSVSRLGGSEVVILLTDLVNHEIVHPVLSRLIAAYDAPFTIEGNEFHLELTAGVSVFPADGNNADNLVRAANSALREAGQKQEKNAFRFFDAEFNRQSIKRIRLEADLHKAISNNEFLVYYQPKVDLRTGDILGMEALLRWKHPKLGMVSPVEFIHIAEQIGLIGRISQWVINTVCCQMTNWQESGYGDLQVAVNISPVEFRNPKLAENIISIMQEYPISVGALEIEVTEGVMIQNLDTAVHALTALSEAGCSISIDDFGTGYSSLSYLRRFPLNKVKIDRTFITGFADDPHDAAIVSAIIAMGQSLGLRVVAEGVETEEQLRYLQDLQCDEIQGYLISRPIPKEEVSELLAHARSIKRQITEYGIRPAGRANGQGVSPDSGMIGILNEFPSVASRH